jgi:Tfp pilus assembly protein PilN
VSASVIRGRVCRVAVILSITIGLGAALSACGNGGTGLAKQACGHVNRSIALLKQSEQGSSAATAGELKEQAYTQIQAAVPIAAEAANQDGQWQALMTSLSEINRVPEKTLFTALTAECQTADNSNFGEPAPPSSIPPPAPVPASP